MDVRPLKFTKELVGISKKTLEIHHDKLYVGYVKKNDEIREKLKQLSQEIIADKASGGNQTYSELRALKQGETFAVNGVYLHEWYFDVLGGDGDWKKAPELSAAITEKWGSVEGFMKYFSECGMAARGWSLVVWDTKVGRLKQYNGDAHNQGGVWGCLPIIVLDVYEHAYFIDYGSDRKKYIEDFWKNLNWAEAEALYLKAREVQF
ncbi:MAG: Fe-Mn family superoxide dismutase [bacterium]|nr:Fe-Mn family superoxide dismutase [bacterium]